MMSVKIAVLAAAAVLAQAGTGLTFTPPAGWQAMPSASSMRVAQYALPRAAGDTADAELIVYYFGGSGGTVAANIERWIAQMQQPDGKPSAAAARQTTRTLNGLKATHVDVSGTYVAEVTPGSQQRYNNPNYRLRAVVVETPRGPYFVKLVGPARTVAAHESSFEQFLASARFSQ
jgi:hypothetical protein